MNRRELFRRAACVIPAFILLCAVLLAGPARASGAAGLPAADGALLDTGETVNAKMKSLAAGESKPHTASSALIRAIRMASALPEGFTPSDGNTVSAPGSTHPVHIFFDGTDGAGILYVWSGGFPVVLNPDSSCLLRRHTALEDISGLSDWDASRVESLYMAFSQDYALASLEPLAAWNTERLTDLGMAFMYNTALTGLRGLEGWNVSAVTRLTGAFSYNAALTDLSALAGWDTGNVRDMTQAFEELTALTSLHGLENWNTASCETLHRTFRADPALTDISAVAGWDISNVTDLSGLFSGDASIRSADLSRWNTARAVRMSGMFNGARSLSVVDATGWDTGRVTDMKRMFSVGASHEGDGQLAEIRGLGGWDVSNVTDMTCMFYGAGRMTHYDIAGWDVSKVESFNHMFTDNFSLEALDLSAWDVSSLRTVYNMFDDCRSLVTVGDVSRWNTACLVDAGGWLNGASSFTGIGGVLDLSGWNTGSLKVAGEMLRDTRLRTVDLTGWTFSAVTNDLWDTRDSSIYYTAGNAANSAFHGLAGMFMDMPLLQEVLLSRDGLDSFGAAAARGVDTSDLWTGSPVSGFTAAP